MIKKLVSLILGCSTAVTLSVGSISVSAEEITENVKTDVSISFYESVMETKNDIDTIATIEESDSVAEFVENNFSTFVSEYNVSGQGGELLATYVEFSTSIYLIEDEEYGVYLDFNDDNGYAVITNDYVIYELETEGDLAELRNEIEIIYSTADGFVYFDENNVCQRVYPNETDDVVYSGKDYSSVYPGQTEAGDGEIDSDSISDYIEERYSDYTYVSENENLEDDFDYALQSATSYYIKVECDENGNANGSAWTEGNCALNAMFNVMRSWAKQSIISNVDYSSTSNISSTIVDDPLYSDYGSYIVRSSTSTTSLDTSADDEETEYYYWRPNYNSALRVMPDLYSNIRAYAICQYGYTPESGFYSSNVPDTLETVAENRYGSSIEVDYTSTVSTAISAIDNGEAVYMSISGSDTYGNHGVAMIGYQKYSYTSGWWIFSSTKYAYFYQIADGWNNSAVYFDPNTDADPSLNFAVLG